MNLIDLVAPDSVHARVGAADRDEAVALAGQLLVERGAVEPGYVAAMLRILDEIGPYAVVAPGVAMPHARPEDGVHEAAISVVTLAAPVAFGHSHNDPVDLVVAFAAIDKRSHLDALQQLAEVLGDADAVARMRAAATDADLFEAVLAHVD
jgi:ascorbate PTS system EIIA or EIIAB component